MRQIGEPPEVDSRMAALVIEAFTHRGVPTKDADATTGGGDFLQRILGLIRGTGFTIAIFSHETRANALANIMLELGFAAMCGKPLIVVKSKEAKAPSDLTRTDWVAYDPDDEAGFVRKLNQALDTISAVGEYEEGLLDIALDAHSIDYAVALERASKSFLLTGRPAILDKAEQVRTRLRTAMAGAPIADLERLKSELSMFIRLGRAAAAA